MDTCSYYMKDRIKTLTNQTNTQFYPPAEQSNEEKDIIDMFIENLTKNDNLNNNPLTTPLTDCWKELY